MDKLALRDRMLALEEAELAHAREKYAEFLAEARLAENETHERDEMAQAVAAGDLAESFDQPVRTHAEKLDHIKAIDFGPKTEVGEGAAVRLGNRWLVIAVATDRFECGGHSAMGISIAAPIYRAMQGLTAGESFVMNGRETVIDEVL